MIDECILNEKSQNKVNNKKKNDTTLILYPSFANSLSTIMDLMMYQNKKRI